MKQRDLQVAFCGFGRRGQAQYEAWKHAEGVSAVAIADPSPAARDSAVAAGLRAYERWDVLLEQETVDAACVVAPAGPRAREILACLARGIPVLSEPPPGNDFASTRDLLAAAHRCGVPLQFRTPLRHVPDLRKARDLIRHGVIGEIVMFRVELGTDNAVLAAGSSAASLLMHATDLVRFLLSGIHKTQAVALRSSLPEPPVLMLAASDCGATGQILVSSHLPASSGTYLVVQGSQGLIRADWHTTVLAVEGEPPVTLGPGFDRAAAEQRSIALFRDLVRGEEEGWIRLEDLLAAANVMEAAQRSLHTGRWARVPSATFARLPLAPAAGWP